MQKQVEALTDSILTEAKIIMGRKGISNKELAFRMGVSYTNVTGLLRGARQNLSLQTLIKLSQALDSELTITVA